MKLDASAVHYLLAREFGDVVSEGVSRSRLFDYPILYDETSDMSGHTVLIPEHERPYASQNMADTLCVCLGDASAASALAAGCPVVHVRGGVAFQRLYNYMQKLFVRNERMDAQLRAYVDAQSGYQLLVDTCARALGWSCALMDDRYRIVCQCAPVASEYGGTHHELLEADVIDLFMASRGYRHMRKSRNVFAMPGSGDLFMKNVFSGDRLIGMLVARHSGDVANARFVRFLLRYLCPFIEEMYERIGTFEPNLTNPGRVRAAIQGAMSGDKPDCAGLESALADDGHKPNATYVVVRIERGFTHEGVEGRDYLARRFELAWPRSYCFEGDGNLFMLADVDQRPSPDHGRFWQALPIAARDNLAKVGISRSFDAMESLAAACAQASVALAQGQMSDPMRWTYRFEDYALSWMVARAGSGYPPAHVWHPAVSDLARHDERYGTDLLGTLSMFMRCRYNATDAARELFVARSTLLNRLERIELLTGINLEDPDERLYLAISIALWSRGAKQGE